MVVLGLDDAAFLCFDLDGVALLLVELGGGERGGALGSAVVEQVVGGGNLTLLFLGDRY